MPGADSSIYRIPLEFPFVIRHVHSGKANDGTSRPTRLAMVNQFGPRVDETNDDKMELKIVPMENVFVKTANYLRFPLPLVENGDGDVGSVIDEDEGKGVAERLVSGEAEQSTAKENMYVGFYMGVSRFDVNGEKRDEKYPFVPVTINSRLQLYSKSSTYSQGDYFWMLQTVMYVNADGNYDLSINSGKGMYNTYWQAPQQLDLTTVYVIRFRSLQRRDARHIFNIAGRKFYCQQLKYEVVGGKLSDIIEGTFYPLKG